MEVVQPPNKELLEKSKLNKKGNYLYYPIKKPWITKYTLLIFLRDGRVMFQERIGVR